MPRQRSASFLVLEFVIGFLMIGGLFTIVARPWRLMLGTSLFSFSTKWGQNLGSWLSSIFAWIMLFALVAYVFYALILSRQPTP